MDKKTRGYIEAIMDEILSDEKIVEDIEWVQEELPISSLRDLSIGYAIGALTAWGWAVIRINPSGRKRAPEEEVEKTIMKLIKRRLLEITKTIERELHR